MTTLGCTPADKRRVAAVCLPSCSRTSSPVRPVVRRLPAERGGQAVVHAQYLAYVRWAFHGQFTGQDAWAVDLMDIPPERLYRPDVSVIEWRRLVEKNHR